MPNPNQTMRAWTHARRGTPRDVFQFANVPRPQITSPTDVLVGISYCALNPAGSIVMQLLPFTFRGKLAVPEMDFSGVVLDVGEEVKRSKPSIHPGTKVFGSISLDQHVKGTGALAEAVVVNHNAITPTGMTLSEAAGLGIAGATALELMRAANLKRGDKVLVNGASGGIGNLVLQMCCNTVGSSGSVVAICSTSNVNWVQELGAKRYHQDLVNEPNDQATRFQVIDYKQNTPLTTHLSETFENDRFDAIIDAVGIQEVFESSPAFLKDGKPYVTVGPKASAYTYVAMLSTICTMAKNLLWPRLLGGTPRPYVQVTAASNQDSLQTLAKMVENDELEVHVGCIEQLDNAKDAYDKLLSRHAQGKIVVRVGKDLPEQPMTIGGES